MKQALRIQQMLACALILVTGVASAAVNSPVTLLEKVSNQMLAKLQQHQSQLKGNPQIIDQIVKQVLIPHVDLSRMSASVLGRQYWISATPTQRSTFIHEFTTTVISTYSAALSSYDGDTIKFYPLRGNYTAQTTVQVNSVIIRRNGQKIPVSYNLIRSGNIWKVYDFSIENVSMVQSYRSQFSGVLGSSGLAGLLTRLKAHNRANR